MKFSEVIENEDLHEPFVKAWGAQGFYMGDGRNCYPECKPWEYIVCYQDFTGKDVAELAKKWYAHRLPQLIEFFCDYANTLSEKVNTFDSYTSEISSLIDEIDEVNNALQKLKHDARKLCPHSVDYEAIGKAVQTLIDAHSWCAELFNFELQFEVEQDY